MDVLAGWGSATSPAGTQQQPVVMETEPHCKKHFKKRKKEKKGEELGEDTFLNSHCVSLKDSRRASSHLWLETKQNEQVSDVTFTVNRRISQTLSHVRAVIKQGRSTVMCWPCGLHLPGGLWVFKHLDNWLSLWLELLQLGHHSTPLLPQSWNNAQTHISQSWRRWFWVFSQLEVGSLVPDQRKKKKGSGLFPAHTSEHEVITHWLMCVFLFFSVSKSLWDRTNSNYYYYALTASHSHVMNHDWNMERRSVE